MSDQSTRGPKDPDSHPMQWVRLSRMARSLELDLSVHNSLAKELEDALRTPPPMPSGDGPQSVERELVQIRGLIELNRPWQEIEPIAWQAFGKNPSDQLAASLVELVFLHGGTTRLVEVLHAFRRLGIGFYFEVKPEIRSLVVTQLWSEGHQNLVNRFVHAVGHEAQLVPVEHLFRFWSLYSSKDPRRCFQYFQQQETQLVAAIAAFGDAIGMSLSYMYLTAGRLGIQLGYEVLARRALVKIGDEDAEYQEAMTLLLQLRIDRDENGNCIYGRRLAALGAWWDRIRLLERFLTDAKHLSGTADINRPALNALLEDPLKWVPGIPEAWGLMSQLVIRFLDVNNFLPNIAKLFEGRALQFMPAPLERALWSPLETIATGDEWKDKYWRGIALLHRYALGENGYESALWEAREVITEATKVSGHHFPFLWARLMRNMEKWLAKTPVMEEKKRQLMLAQVRMAQDEKSIEAADVTNYLAASVQPDYRILSTVIDVCQARSIWKLELDALSKRGQFYSFTNSDLNRMWKLSLSHDDHDMAWRVATVLHSRGCLHEDVVHRWSFSGEMRSDYAFSPLARSDVELVLRRFENEERKFLESLVDVGPLVPELLSYLHEGKLVLRKPEALAGTKAAEVKEFLDRLLWMPLAKKTVEPELSGDDILGSRLPCFVQVMPHNAWSEVVVYLGIRLGIAAWSWNVGRLHSSIASMLPLAVSGNVDHAPVKVGRWVKALSAEQKIAWQNLISSSSMIQPERGVSLIATFLGCFSLSLYQNHLAALDAMRKMRVDVNVIHAMEKWILSDDYTKLRKKLGTNNRIKVPQTLFGLDSVLAPYQSR